MQDSPSLFHTATILWVLFMAMVLALATIVVPPAGAAPVASPAPAIDVTLSATGEVDQSQIAGTGFAFQSDAPRLAATLRP